MALVAVATEQLHDFAAKLKDFTKFLTDDIRLSETREAQASSRARVGYHRDNKVLVLLSFLNLTGCLEINSQYFLNVGLRIIIFRNLIEI